MKKRWLAALALALAMMLLGAAALIFRNQGSNVVINYFFGTVVNAAYAISYAVQNYIITFVGNFDIASAPQITQNISRGNMDRTVFLASSTCRICILLTLLLLHPRNRTAKMVHHTILRLICLSAPH